MSNAQTDPTDSEKITIEKVLRRMRKQKTSVDGQQFTLADIHDELRHEAYLQEKAGCRRLARVLDAADNCILALLIERADAKKFGRR